MKKNKIKYLMIGLILGIVLMTGCGSKKGDSTEQTRESVTEQSKDERTEDNAIANKGEEIKLSIGEGINRKIIKTGELSIETKTFEQCVNTISDKIQQVGGYVENSQVEGTSYYEKTAYRHANITARIPNKIFDKFINQADEFGNVISKSMQGEDVTSQYVDTKARIKSLEVQRERLMALLQKSGSLEELFAVEKELANVSYELEQFQGTLNQYDSLIDYSTIQIHISEVQTYQHKKTVNTFSSRIVESFTRSMQNVKELGQNLVLLLVALIPFILIVGIPITILVILIRKLRKRGTKKE